MMSDEPNRFEYTRALEDFRQARAKARMQQLWSAITGQSKELLQYDEISKKMHISGQSSKGVQEIPIESIVGSVNRYQDFDENFLPLLDSDMQRWANVKASMISPGSPGLSPIRVYKIGDAYFVLDGNHRVSIAKQMGFETIEAHVTEIKTKVPFSFEDSPDDIILKAEYADFLERTKFDKVCSDVSLKLTFPGQYETLEEHIRVHRHYMGIEQYREIPPEEACRHWYENVYQPIIEIIREQQLLQVFPQRTETDLYIWILDHQSMMEKEYGWSIRPEKVTSDLANRYGKRLLRALQRFGRKLVQFFIPKQLKGFSSPGKWHEGKKGSGENLFSDILVPMSGSPDSWLAVEQAIIIAEIEKGNVRGLYVSAPSKPGMIDEDDFSRAFSERLNLSGMTGKIAFSKGQIAGVISDRAQFNDLVVLKLNYPPLPKIFNRLSSGFRTILQNSTRPVLVVKDKVSVMNHILLAYDGSPKGKEALYVAAYIASRYQKRLSVVIIENNLDKGSELQKEVNDYLNGFSENIILQRKNARVGKEILKVASKESADVIVMGGYGLSPLFEILFGSTVDSVLRGTNIPVIVCQ